MSALEVFTHLYLQADLPVLYRGHDLLLFTSRYEAWGMPVLEGFASGLAVVATRCLGIASFAEHEHNCLLANPGVTALNRRTCLGSVLLPCSGLVHLPCIGLSALNLLACWSSPGACFGLADLPCTGIFALYWFICP